MFRLFVPITISYLTLRPYEQKKPPNKLQFRTTEIPTLRPQYVFMLKHIVINLICSSTIHTIYFYFYSLFRRTAAHDVRQFGGMIK